MIQSQPQQIIPRDPISKKKNHKKRTGGVIQGVGPFFVYHKKRKKELEAQL
jgi:hypothetical protein